MNTIPNIRHLSFLLVALGAMATLSGCGTVFSGRTQKISVMTTPDGATLLVDDKVVGTSPALIPVPRGRSGTITIRKAGYEDFTQSLSSQSNASAWLGNSVACYFLSTGTFGSSTDLATGSAYEFAPDQFHVELKPVGGFVDNKEMSNAGAVTKEGQITRYVLTNHDALRTEISKEEGERLRALRELMGYEKLPFDEFLRLVQPCFRQTSEKHHLAQRLAALAK